MHPVAEAWATASMPAPEAVIAARIAGALRARVAPHPRIVAALDTVADKATVGAVATTGVAGRCRLAVAGARRIGALYAAETDEAAATEPALVGQGPATTDHRVGVATRHVAAAHQNMAAVLGDANGAGPAPAAEAEETGAAARAVA